MSRDEGFTLLEFIVALAILGVLLGSLAHATHFALYVWSSGAKEMENVASMEMLDHVLRSLIEQATPPVDAADEPLKGYEHIILFRTRLPDEPEVQGVRSAEVAIGIDHSHRLILRWRPSPNATLLAATEPTMQEIILADGLERVDFAYRDAVPGARKWSKTWLRSDLPEIIQIKFIMAKGYRGLPDLELETMLD
jgi:prepilin-type N-terminal cleavage/methylation domain-containing protein